MLWLLITPAVAQTHFTAQVNTKEMNKNDYVELQFVLENAKDISKLQPPDLSDFNIVQGPNESTGMTVTNGVMTEYKGISFLLQPKKTGRLLIGAANAVADGQQLKTNPIQILVHNSSGNNLSGNSSQPPAGFAPMPDPSWPAAQPAVDMDEVLKPGDNVAEKISKNFFVKVEVSKKDCFVGEPIVATYKLYARLRSDSRVTRHPSLNGFSVYDMIDPADDRISVEKYNGRNYSVHIIRKAQLIPLQAGDVTLDPVELDNNIYFIKSERNTAKSDRQGLSSLFDRLFEPDRGGTPFTQHIVLESKPLVVHVSPLPETGKPANFNGAVGKYSMSAFVNSKEIDTGDAAILSVTIKGEGNLPLVNAPAIDWPAGMDSYDMKSKENIEKAVSPLGGNKTFSFSFVSSKPGQFIVPPVRMSYFDPVSKSYKNIETNPVHLGVNISRKKKSVATPAPSVAASENNWSGIIFWSAIFLLLVCSLVFIVGESKKDAVIKANKARLAAEVELIRNLPPIVHPLAESRQLMESGDFSRFYGAINRAVWKVVSDTLKLPASDLNKLSIASGLRAKGWTDEEIMQLKNILNECEMKLYTPEYSADDMQRLLAETEKVTDRLGST